MGERRRRLRIPARFKPLLRLSLAFLGAALFLLAPAALFAQEEPSIGIAGRVVNGTAGASTPREVMLEVHLFRQGREVEARLGAVDAEGRFAFADLPGGEEVLYVLVADYQGVPYTLEVGPEEALDGLVLTVFEPGATLEELSLSSHALFVVGVAPATRSISFLEVMEVRNRSDRTFLPGLSPEEAMSFLRFPLPPNASGLDVSAELPAGDVLQVDRGFVLTTPVPPGKFDVVFTYVAPYEGAQMDLGREVSLEAEVFRLFVRQGLEVQAGGPLAASGTTLIGETSYQVYEAQGLPPGSRLPILLTDLSGPSVWQNLSRGLTSLGPLAIAGSLGMLLLFLLAYALLVRRGERPAAEPAALGGEPGREALLRAIAALDDRFAQGELSSELYEGRRQELMARLLRLTAAEEEGR